MSQMPYRLGIRAVVLHNLFCIEMCIEMNEFFVRMYKILLPLRDSRQQEC